LTITGNTLNLNDLSDEAFDDIVNQDTRGALDSVTSAALREPEHLDRWYDMLLTLKRRVEAQLAANRGEQAAKQAEYLSLGDQGKVLWLRYKASNEKWRQGAIRFKNGLEDKLAEAKRLRMQASNESYPTILTRERDHALKKVVQLRSAIVEHKLATVNEEGDQDDIDTRLWGLADDNVLTG
jgi:hypothetical protein